MAINDFYQNSADELGSGTELIIDGSGSGTGAVEVHEIYGSAGCTLYKEIDTAGDGSYSLSVEIDSFIEPFHSQKNQIEVSNSANVRLRLVNTSGGAADFAVNGMEVDN